MLKALDSQHYSFSPTGNFLLVFLLSPQVCKTLPALSQKQDQTDHFCLQAPLLLPF